MAYSVKLYVNGKSIRNLAELLECFIPSDVLERFRDGKLQEWLEFKGETQKAQRIKDLQSKKPNDEEALNGIVAVFGIDIESASQKLYKIGMRLLESKEGDRDARRAVECLRKAADMGCADAQYQLAECWNGGISESNWFGACKDRSEAISLYKAAAEQGHPDAQLSYGDELENEESIHWWKMAAKNPRAGAECRADARYWLARAYYEGEVVRKNVGIALDYMRKAAIDDQEGFAQDWLGDRYRLGEGVQKIPRTAYEWYDKAAKCGNVSGQYWLAWCYDEGFGIREDPENALECYKKVAEREEEIDCEVDWAQYRIGEFYHLGRGVSDVDPQKAFEWYEKSAKRGYADAQYWLGWCYETEFGTKENLQKAVEWYKEGAGQEHAKSQCALGLCYLNGKGIAVPDHREGFAWLSKAAKQGDAQAKYELGCCYLCGIGCQPNATEAFVLLSAAGHEGYPPAQRELGKRYLEGDIVMHLPKDPKRAIDWLKKAASGDCPDAEAARLLGNCYFDGVGQICEMHGEAFKCYQKAAEKGDAKAMFNLARCYQRGWGTRPDKVAAKEWAEKAVGAGDEDVANDAERLLEQLLAQ